MRRSLAYRALRRGAPRRRSPYPPQEFAQARGAADARADRGARARDRQRARFPQRPAAYRRCRWRSSPACAASELIRPINAVGLYVPAGSAPPALRGDHAGRAGAHRGLPAAHPVHPARSAMAAPTRPCWSPPSCAASTPSSRSAAPRPSRRSPMAPQTIPKVDKIFGPGNAWVTAAKQLVAADPDGAACDLPAGPSEVLVIADDDAPARTSWPRICWRRPSTIRWPRRSS